MVSAEDLSGERFVAFDEGLTIRKRSIVTIRRHRVEVKVTIAFDNVETIKRAIESAKASPSCPAHTAKDLQRGRSCGHHAGAAARAAVRHHSPQERVCISRTVQRFIEFFARAGVSKVRSRRGFGLGRACG